MSGGRRTVVMSPQTRQARHRGGPRRPRRVPRLETAELERARALRRAQLTRGLPTLGALFALVFGMPLALNALPVLDEIRVVGVPLSWVMLVLVPFPVMSLLALRQLRRAETLERSR
ncbi:hypothetical protein [Actinopolyspora saharensis]|uniref:hypothetical protein n=1 Tax=Actinopolyspora saharensis TaxID=995062 RepID=UPI003F664B1D